MKNIYYLLSLFFLTFTSVACQDKDIEREAMKLIAIVEKVTIIHGHGLNKIIWRCKSPLMSMAQKVEPL